MVSILMNLIKLGLCPELCSEKNLQTIAPEKLQKLIMLAKFHDLTSVVGATILQYDLVPPGEAYASVQKDVCKQAALCEKMNYELEWVRQTLETANIPFIPLKGAVVRQYYPEPWMRSSCDIDILIHKEMLQNTVDLLVEKGCSIYCDEKQHDVSLITPGRVHLELHFRLLESIGRIDSVLDRVWAYCQPAEGMKYEFRQSGEFLLFHLLSHMAYHLKYGGCGIRSFVDIWLLQRKMTYDEAELVNLCREAGLEKFYRTVQHLVDVWFDGKEHTAVTQRLEQFIISGGTFGNADNRILIDQAKAGSRKKRLMKRIFMPYEGLKTQYPVLKKRKWLMPVFQVVRWLRIFTGGRLKRAIAECRISHSHSDTRIHETKVFMKQIGLD